LSIKNGNDTESIILKEDIAFGIRFIDTTSTHLFDVLHLAML